VYSVSRKFLRPWSFFGTNSSNGWEFLSESLYMPIIRSYLCKTTSKCYSIISRNATNSCHTERSHPVNLYISLGQNRNISEMTWPISTEFGTWWGTCLWCARLLKILISKIHDGGQLPSWHRKIVIRYMSRWCSASESVVRHLGFFKLFFLTTDALVNQFCVIMPNYCKKNLTV